MNSSENNTKTTKKDAPAPKNRFDTKDRYTKNRKLSFSKAVGSGEKRSIGLLLGLFISCWLIVVILWFACTTNWTITTTTLWDHRGKVSDISYKIWQWPNLKSITNSQAFTAQVIFGISTFALVVGIAGTLILFGYMYAGIKNQDLWNKVIIALWVLGIISFILVAVSAYFISDMSRSLQRQEITWLRAEENSKHY